MNKYVINGPTRLKGEVTIQGAKNSSMKHVFIPLISEGTYTLENIPGIGSIEKHIELIKLFGSDIRWLNKNTVQIGTKNLKLMTKIPKEYIYYTSGGNHIIPILVSKFGKCEIEIDNKRVDYGGDQIGSRKFKDIIETLSCCGINSEYTGNSSILFSLSSTSPFVFNVPVHSFTASVLAMFSALFKKGKSVIKNYTKVHEFWDIVEYLKVAGAKINIQNNNMQVYGPAELKGVTYKNMNDPHDFVTWLFLALATNSELTINGIEYEKMKLSALENIMNKMNIDVDLKDSSAVIKSQLSKIKPISLLAGQYPLFTTEWQVLISPLLSQIKGTSNVVETFFSNRMQHWMELEKLGTTFTFYQDKHYKEINNQPRAVKVTGPQKLTGGRVNALDVRTGAALVIAGLVAEGKTEIYNTENIERGYENLVERLKGLGADIKIEDF